MPVMWAKATLLAPIPAESPFPELSPRAIALQAVTPDVLARELGCALGEARKIVSMVHRDKPLAPAAGPPRDARGRPRAGGAPTVRVVAEQASRVDPFVKYVIETGEGEARQVVETVRIPLERAGRFSVCVSSQAGCALACAFCATGRMGLRRNLETWEIVEQVRVVSRGIKGAGLGRVHGVVFQGMGEPLANCERVRAAIAVMSDPSGLAIDARAMTVCTSGCRAASSVSPGRRRGSASGSRSGAPAARSAAA